MKSARHGKAREDVTPNAKHSSMANTPNGTVKRKLFEVEMQAPAAERKVKMINFECVLGLEDI